MKITSPITIFVIGLLSFYFGKPFLGWLLISWVVLAFLITIFSAGDNANEEDYQMFTPMWFVINLASLSMAFIFVKIILKI